MRYFVSFSILGMVITWGYLEEESLLPAFTSSLLLNSRM